MKGSSLHAPSNIHIHEWAIVLIFSGLLLSLSFYTYMNSDPLLMEDPVGEPYFVRQLTIEVKGAVKKEGLYNLPYGATVKEAIEMAEPLPEANLEKVQLKKVLKRKQKITVPRKKIGKKTSSSLQQKRAI